MSDDALQLLNNLLVVVHRDGGHYSGRWGLEKSVQDAYTVINEDRTKRDEALAELERVQKQAAAIQDVLQWLITTEDQLSCAALDRIKFVISSDAGKGYVREAPAYEYAARLFKYRAPECTPLPDLMGVLTQLDNLLTGMVWKEDVKPLADCLDHIKTLALECREDPKIVLAAVGLSACGGVGIAKQKGLLP